MPQILIVIGLIACAAIFTGTLLHREGRALTSRDSHQYWSIGKHLAEGRGFSFDGHEPTRMRQPLYPMLLAASIILFGKSTLPVLFVQLALALGTVLIVVAIAREVFGEFVGGVAGLVAGLYYAFPVLANEIRPEALYTFLLALIVLLWARAVKRRDLRLVVACGVAIGLATLTRPVALPFVAAVPIALWAQFGRRRDGLLAAGMLAVVACATLVPWGARNLASLGTFSVTSDAGSAALYMGTHPMVFTEWQDEMTAIEATDEFRRLQGDDSYLGPDASRRFRAVAVQRLYDDPLRTLGGCIAKVPLTWSYAPGSRPWLVKSPLTFYLMAIPQLLLLVLIVMGSRAAPRSVQWMTAIVFVVVSATIFMGSPTARYTIPFMPLGLALAAQPLAAFVARIARARDTIRP